MKGARELSIEEIHVEKGACITEDSSNAGGREVAMLPTAFKCESSKKID
jgi:hypothetical protein